MTRIIAAILLLAGVVRAADTNTYRGILLAPGSVIPIAYAGSTQTGQVNKLTVNSADYRGDLILTGAVGLVTASGDTITITEQNTGLSAANLTAGTVATAIDGNAITNLDLSAYPIENLSNVDSVAAPTTDDVLTWNGAAWTNSAAAGGGNSTGYQRTHVYWTGNEATAPSSYSAHTFYAIDSSSVTQTVSVYTNYCGFNTNTFEFFPPTSGLYQLSWLHDNGASADYRSYSACKLGTNWYGQDGDYQSPVSMEYVQKGTGFGLNQLHRGSFVMYYPEGETNAITLWGALDVNNQTLFYRCSVVFEKIGD